MESPQPAPSVKFPDPEDNDFDEEVGKEERNHYISKYKDLENIKNERIHCTACDRHLGCAPKTDNRMKMHPLLRTLVCRPCHTFYNSGEFERGDDGSELYCRWCGQGGQVYCCSECPHVFCAKCIKRNMGAAKIREIESLDDWKCFKCAPRPLWDLRAVCWALLRYCDHMNKIAHTTEDSDLKEKYLKECAIDDTDCCKSKKRSSNVSSKKKDPKEEKEKEDEKKKALAKIPSGIKVKKFASISADTVIKNSDLKAVKRPASPPKVKLPSVRAPIPIAPYPRPLPPSIAGPPLKKMKIQTPPQLALINPLLEQRRLRQQYMPRPRPRILNPTLRPPVVLPPAIPPQPVYRGHSYNGYNSFNTGDNINLSLESLTQGLDMSAMQESNDELVCTPDFPLEPLCEVTEDVGDDDVQCITPGPVAQPKPSLSQHTSFPDISAENIVQMTDNDVTVNALTGGLKFRVDPQTLSSNKMYRLPDGRIFAINANANMPGGYSATIVAVSETSSPNVSSVRGTTYAANLSTVIAPASTPPPKRSTRKSSQKSKPQSSTPQPRKESKSRSNRQPDMQTPVEWYRYNLLDSLDALQYSVTRLQRLKKEADTHHLRTRTVEEMKALHSQLERHLRTSSSRFEEIRQNLNRGFRSYLRDKGKRCSDEEEDDDDDVEILNEPSKEPEDPIFIDENSVDSILDHSDNDVTALSSDHNDSAERGTDKNEDPLAVSEYASKDSESASQNNKKQSNFSNEKTTGGESNKEGDDAVHRKVPETSKSESEKDSNKDYKGTNDTNKKESVINVKNVDEFVTSESKESKNKNVKCETEDVEMNSVDENQDSKKDKIDNETDKNEESEKYKTDNKNRENKETKKSKSDNYDDDSGEIEKLKSDNENEESGEGKKENEGSQTEKSNSDNEKPKSNDEKPESDNEAIEDIKCNNEDSLIDSIKSQNKVNSTLNHEKSEKQKKGTSEQEEKSDKTSTENFSLNDDSLESSSKEDKGNKINGALDIDTSNGIKDNDNEIQMSDEMIDTLLADDGPPTELTAELQKFTQRSLDSLADTDLMDTEFN